MRQNGHYAASFPFISHPYSAVYDCQRHREKEMRKPGEGSEREKAKKANVQQREICGPYKNPLQTSVMLVR